MRLMITSDFSDQRRYNVPFNLHISYLTMTPCIYSQIRTRRATKVILKFAVKICQAIKPFFKTELRSKN